ncbi:uncharacterized protein LOC127718097 isoform X2 [Mytilus californianus]|uniref:uncharacterized protein LOC127718097 isoform X2 n=1 Tax=Mytilus californianus TaxID=6549 RepID=UPI0022461DDC|nr:uncharacterized protein LOC127718097 isoform X2 [Mytilus californianus]
MIDAGSEHKTIMKLLTSLILILQFLENTDSRPVTTYIAVVGDTVTLSCPERSKNSVTWHGPQDYFPYSEDDQINPLLSSKNIFIVGNNSEGEYNLEIYNVSYANQGNYRCRALHSIPMEFDVLLIIKDKPSTVKAITDYDAQKETHKETNSPVSAFQNTRAYNESGYNTLNVSYRNKGCTKSNDNEFKFIIVCIASFIVVIITVTFLGGVLSKYYKTKYRKQNLSEVGITNDYEEIESTNSDLVQDARILINPINEINIPTIRKEDETTPSDTNIDVRNSPTQSLNEDSLHTTHRQSAIDMIDLTTVYENDTLSCNTNDEDPDAYLHPYVELGPEDYLNPYQPLHYHQS